MHAARVTAFHFTDPGCPWAYSARPAHARLAWRFGDQIDWRLVLIGLSEHASEYEARGLTPGRAAAGMPKFQARFGMPFSVHVRSRIAATARGCRAIVAVRQLDPTLEDAALRALQLMQFTTSGLLDDDEDLRLALSTLPAVDAGEVVARIDDPDVVAAYRADRALARSAEGSATHVQGRHAKADGRVRYTAPSVIFERADGARIEVGGFQPFEAYDTALANLDTSLERRPPPASALQVLEAFPDGGTTAEVAAVLRPSDLDEEDRAAARQELIALAGDGLVRCKPVGGDAVWLLPRPGKRPPPKAIGDARRVA